MCCIKNPKKFFGWIDYFGDHQYKPIKIWKFMDCSDDFCVRFRCKLCGAEYERHFVTWSELLHFGLTNEQIKNIGTTHRIDKSLTLNT